MPYRGPHNLYALSAIGFQLSAIGFQLEKAVP